jgi:hypothetical protein
MQDHFGQTRETLKPFNVGAPNQNEKLPIKLDYSAGRGH